MADDPPAAKPPQLSKFYQQRIHHLLVYLVFLCVFSYYSMRDLTSDDSFYVAENLKEQLAGVEHRAHHSPTTGDTFRDVQTMEQLYFWLHGAFVHTVFSPNTFDGISADHAGYTLGYDKILGSVRLAQLRTNEEECKKVPTALTDEGRYKYKCFSCWKNDNGFGSRQFDTAREEITPFGNGFVYDGVDGVTFKPLPAGTVDDARQRYGSSFTSREWNTYPSPAYGVQMDPMMGVEQGSAIIKKLEQMKYFDLHTRAVFVDIAVFNPMLRQLVYGKLVAEVAEGGGIRTSANFWSVRLWTVGTYDDLTYIVLWGVVCAFYCYYAWEFGRAWYRSGAAFWRSMFTWMQFLNLVCFAASSVLSFMVAMYIPRSVQVSSPHFTDFFNAVQLKSAASAVQATNIFLCWFKLVELLAFAPQYAVMLETLARAARALGGFGVVLVLIFEGFAHAHTLAFHSKIRGFRSFGTSNLQLMRSLLGDFDFDSLAGSQGEPYLGEQQ